MSFSDLFGGLFATPAALDFFGKIHLTKAAKEAARTFQQVAEEEYHKRLRQASLMLVKPLRIFHLTAIATHLLFSVIALFLAQDMGKGSEWKYVWLAVSVLPIAFHVWMYRRLPLPVEYAKDEDGAIKRYPEKLEGTDIDDPWAGMKMLADDYEFNVEKVSPGWSSLWTTVGGVISALAFGVLSGYAEERSLGVLAVIALMLGASCFRLVTSVLSWILGIGAKALEKIGGFFAQLLLNPLPFVKDIGSDVLQNLIPEERIKPWFRKIEIAVVSYAALFLLGLLAKPCPEMLRWTTYSLTTIGLAGYLMQVSGLGDEVRDRLIRFKRFLFGTYSITTVVYGFLGEFFPEQAKKIETIVVSLVRGVVDVLGFISSPCDRIVDQGPKRMILVALIFGFFAMKVFGFWNKAEGKFIRIASMIGLVSVSYVALLSAYGTLIHYQPQFNMCSVPKVEQTQTATASLPVTVAETPLVKEEGDKKEEKKEEVTEAQRLAIDTISGQQEIAMAAVDDIGKYLHNLIASDDIPTKLGVLIQVKQRLKTLETELKVMKDSSKAMSPEGLESLEQVQKQIAKDNDRLQAVKVTIVDGHLAQIPEKENKTLAGVRDRLGSMMAKLRAAPMLNPVSEEESKLAEQRRVAAETAIKLADLRKQKADKEAEEKAVNEAAEATATASSAPTVAKKNRACVNCTPEFAALKAELGI